MTRPNEDAQAEYLRTHPEAKPSNPKDAFGSAKVPVGLVPDTALVELALAHLEGACKYGRFNWRVVGVRASIYNDAMERHRKKWWNGQNRDPVTKVRELASIMACCAILIDSEICGVLEDDRPPMAPLGELLDINMEVVAHLKDLFKDHHPHQYTIADTPGMDEPAPEGFPTGYELHPEEAQGPGTVSAADLCVELHCDKKRWPGLVRCEQHAADYMREPVGALTLDCGCVKRCKGHTTENFRAAPVDVLTEVHIHPALAPPSPGDYAAERASGPRDPQGRPYATTTADAEFPQPPPVHRPVEAAREFDPAD